MKKDHQISILISSYDGKGLLNTGFQLLKWLKNSDLSNIEISMASTLIDYLQYMKNCILKNLILFILEQIHGYIL